MKILLGLFFAAGLFAACDEEKNGQQIKTTRVKPPVEAALPGALLVSGISLTTDDYTKTCQTDLSQGDVCQTYSGGQQIQCIIKQRLFCKGPSNVLSLLDNLDSRLREIEKRSSNQDVPCLDATPVDLSGQITFPGSVTKEQKFQCQDQSIGLGFGEDAGTWYVREGGGTKPIGSAFSVFESDVVQGYLWLGSADKSFAETTALMRIYADQSQKTVEITGGGVGLGFCAFHYKSTADLIYVVANPDGAAFTCDYNGDNSADENDWDEACLIANSLDSAAEGACDSLKAGLQLTTLGRAETVSSTGTTWAEAVSNTSISLVRFGIGDDLNEINAEARTFAGVPDFMSR